LETKLSTVWIRNRGDEPMMRLKSMRAVVALLAAAGCGSGTGSPGSGTTEGPVTRLEMAEVEAAISEHRTVECNRPRLIPILNCVEELPDGRFKAHFGYNNPNSNTVDIEVGRFTGFIPRPRDRGQPTSFLTGVHADVFAVTWNGSPLVWILTRNFAIASRNSTRCGPPPPMCPATCDDGNPCTVDHCG